MAWTRRSQLQIFPQAYSKKERAKHNRRIVTADGRILTSLPDIKSEAVTHFETFLNGTQETDMAASQDILRDLITYRCSSEDAATLMKPVLAAEIKETIFSMPANKAPGPDGYLVEFYKAAWSVIGKDVVAVVQSFFIFGFMPHNINATLLSLVPKTLDAEKLTDYRPIACCNVIYKVISKIIARRMKIRNQFHFWTSKTMSYAGRLQLIKSVIASIANFWCSAFYLPQVCIDEIESMCSAFLWSCSPNNTACAKICWEDVYVPLDEGGLGIRRLKEVGIVFVLKLIWTLLSTFIVMSCLGEMLLT